MARPAGTLLLLLSLLNVGSGCIRAFDERGASADLFVDDGDKAANFSETHLWLPIALEETQIAPTLTTYPDASLFN